MKWLIFRAAKHYLYLFFFLSKERDDWTGHKHHHLETTGRRYKESYTQITQLIIVADVSTKRTSISVCKFLIWFCPCVLVLVSTEDANKL